MRRLSGVCCLGLFACVCIASASESDLLDDKHNIRALEGWHLPLAPNAGGNGNGNNQNNGNTGNTGQNGAVTSTTYEHQAQMPVLPNQGGVTGGNGPTNPGATTSGLVPQSTNLFTTTVTANAGRGVAIGAGIVGGAAALAGVGVAIAHAVHHNQAMEATLNGVKTRGIVPTPGNQGVFGVAGSTTGFSVRPRESGAGGRDSSSSGSLGSGSLGSGSLGENSSSGSNNSISMFIAIPLLFGICGLCIGAFIYLHKKSKSRSRGSDSDDEEMMAMPRGAPYQQSPPGQLAGGFPGYAPQAPAGYNTGVQTQPYMQLQPNSYPQPYNR